jgi:hypothetical protein
MHWQVTRAAGRVTRALAVAGRAQTYTVAAHTMRAMHVRATRRPAAGVARNREASTCPAPYRVRGNPRSTELVPGSGQRAVTTFARV